MSPNRIQNGNIKSNWDDSKALDYLEGKLSKEEQREFELLISDDTIESEVFEGLSTMKTEDIKKHITKLHYSLHRKVLKGKRKKKKEKPLQFWNIIITVVLLILLLMAFVYLLFVTK